MAEAPEDTFLTVPPVPLASGQLILGDGRPRRVRAVELVMTTEDGGEARVSLQERHGAWWPPIARSFGLG